MEQLRSRTSPEIVIADLIKGLCIETIETIETIKTLAHSWLQNCLLSCSRLRNVDLVKAGQRIL